jgi:hypothetical protein
MAHDIGSFRPRQRLAGASARRLVSPPPRLMDRATAGLTQPFTGITTDGTTLPNLFPIASTGVSTEPLRRAAEAYLEALTPQQRARGLFAVTDERIWRSWSNIHPFLMRHGVCFEEMTPEQSQRALALVRESLSAQGFNTARDVMKLNEVIGEITQRPDEYGEWVYWVSIMGVPSATEPWGWQLDGHHLNLNCFILGDQMVLTPMFMGSEPVVADTRQYGRLSVLQAEQDLGLAFMQSLPTDLQQQASLGLEHPSESAGFADNTRILPAGIRYAELSAAAQRQLTDLIEVYVGRIRPDHARVRLDEVKTHLADTSFAWAGPWDDEAAFYYRVYSPVILIEFDHQSGVALESEVPSRDHIHTVVRTPNGNDYGQDLLRQHYARFAHVNGAHVPR